MGWYLFYIALSDQNDAEDPPIMRRLETVPGMRSFLLETWRNGSEAELECPQDGDLMDSEWAESAMEMRNGRFVYKEPGIWCFVLPGLFVELYPQDPEVRDIVLEWLKSTFGNGQDNLQCNALFTLNRMKVRSEEINELRIQCLFENDNAEDSANAAKGLALMQTESGFDAMLEWLTEDEHRRNRRIANTPHVLEAMVSYGARVVPHAQRVRDVAKNLGLIAKEGETISRPAGYNIFPNVGHKYRTQQALRSLNLLERRYPELVSIKANEEELEDIPLVVPDFPDSIPVVQKLSD